jgi:peptidoglycan-associated lipoprotein
MSVREVVRIGIFTSCLVLTACFRSAKKSLSPEDTVLKNPSRATTDEGYFGALPGRDASFLPHGNVSNTLKYGGLYDERDVSTSVFFSFDDATLDPKARAELSRLTAQLTGDRKVLVAGHCDWYGTEEYNLRLGDNRAKSVESELVRLGVLRQHVDTVSMGSAYATSGLEKSEAWGDRRADLVVFPERR